jgi:tetratricopeptide (TPR) repeat protein
LSDETKQRLVAARKLIDSDNFDEALELLEADEQLDHPRVLSARVRLRDRLGNQKAAAELALSYVDLYPWDTDFLYTGSRILARAGYIDIAVDVGERLRLRRPGHVRNLKHLAHIYAEELGNSERAEELRTEAADLSGE